MSFQVALIPHQAGEKHEPECVWIHRGGTDIQVVEVTQVLL